MSVVVPTPRLRELLARSHDEEDRAILQEVLASRERFDRRETPVWRALIAACNVSFWYRDLAQEDLDRLEANVAAMPGHVQATRSIAIAAFERALAALGVRGERLAGDVGEELGDAEVAFREEVSRLTPPIAFVDLIRLSVEHGLIDPTEVREWEDAPEETFSSAHARFRDDEGSPDGSPGVVPDPSCPEAS